MRKTQEQFLSKEPTNLFYEICSAPNEAIERVEFTQDFKLGNRLGFNI